MIFFEKYLNILCLLLCMFTVISGSSIVSFVLGSINGSSPGVYGIFNTYSQEVIPGARFSSVSWSISNETTDLFYIFGGAGFGEKINFEENKGKLNDMFVFNKQKQMWKWISGSSFVNQESHVEVMDKFDSKNKIGGRKGSISFTSRDRAMFVWGGEGYGCNCNGMLNDLWQFCAQVNEWKPFNTANVTCKCDHVGIVGPLGVWGSYFIPTSRYRAMKFQSISNNRFFIFGGSNGWSKDCYSDLWEWNITTNEWRYLKGVYPFEGNDFGYYGFLNEWNDLNRPPARLSGSTWSVNDEMFFLFGGRNSFSSVKGDLYNDLWEYSVSKNMWRWIHGEKNKNTIGIYGIKSEFNSNNAPGARCGSISFISNDNAKLMLLGGEGFDYQNGPKFLNDLWIFSIDNPKNEWTWINGNKNYRYQVLGEYVEPYVIGPRESAVTWRDKTGEVYIFGGYGMSNECCFDYLSDVWKVDKLGTCSGVHSYDSTVCNSHGRCEENKCICDNHYFEKNCNAWRCNGVLFNDTAVCSQQGKCEGNDLCVCNNKYDGKACENKKLSCGNYVFDDFGNVCNGRGNCISQDICDCSSSNHYFGNLCEEMITHALFINKGKTIFVQYQIPYYLVETESKFCSCKIVANSDMLGRGSQSIWGFIGDKNFTSHLLINLGEGAKIQPHEAIVLKIQSLPSKRFSLLVAKGDFPDPKKPVPPPPDDGNTALSLVLVGLALALFIPAVIILLLCCLVIGLIGISYYFKEARRAMRDSRNRKKSKNKKKRKKKKKKGLQYLEMEEEDEEGEEVIDLGPRQLNYDSLKLKNLVGRTYNASIFHAEYENQTKLVAKIFKTGFLSKENIVTFHKRLEVYYMLSKKSTCIVNCFGICTTSSDITILVEGCSLNDLKDFIITGPPYTVDGKIKVLKIIVEAIMESHSKKVILEDLCLSHILVNGLDGMEMEYKINVFGLNKLLGLDKFKHYVAPEVVNEKTSSAKSDIWSLGWIMFEFATENFEYFEDDKKKDIDVTKKVHEDESYRPKDVLEKEKKKNSKIKHILELAEQCWKTNPSDRPSISFISSSLDKLLT